MEGSLQSEVLSFRYSVADSLDLDGRKLIESEQIGDNVMAILARWTDPGVAIVEIVRKLRVLDETGRRAAADQLMILAGLRRLEDRVEEELRKMVVPRR